MPGLIPGIRVCVSVRQGTWMDGTPAWPGDIADTCNPNGSFDTFGLMAVHTRLQIVHYWDKGATRSLLVMKSACPFEGTNVRL